MRRTWAAFRARRRCLPGLSTFTVRVFFYGDRYAGRWQHGAVGGHLSGRIEKRKPQNQ